MAISYKSENGYTGILYGKSSMKILDPEGKEVLHTGFRNIETEAELKERVDEFPKLRKSLLEFYKKMSEEEK